MQADDNPIMELARDTNTYLHAVDNTEAIVGPQGTLLPGEESRKYNELMWSDGVIADAFRLSNEHFSSIDPQKSLYDFFVEKSETMFLNDSAEEANRKRKTFLSLSRIWSTYVGSPITRQSLKFFWLEECIEGENPFVAGSYRKILDAVARTAKEQAKILLETEVKQFHGRRSISGTGDELQGPTLVTVSGDVYSFDEVVVTTPLGWLKDHKKAFQPELPQRLSDAIDHISYGHLDKVYITFPRAFWLGQSQSQQAVGSDPTSSLEKATSCTVPGTGAAPGFVHFLEPAYAESQQWYQSCVDYANMGDYAHPTLLFYIDGPQSKYIASIVRDTTDPQARDKRLLEHFYPFYTRLPHYASSDPACVPRAVLATAWANDKLAGYGSYSNFQVGLEKGDEDIEVMRHGMPERSIWLAGEHTAPFIALGTTTGAYWSGQRVAERIAEAYGLGAATSGPKQTELKTSEAS
jgi:hypothetical protein